MESFAETQGIPFSRNSVARPPAGIEIAFVTDDVDTAFKKAVDAGAVPLKEPQHTHWGQRVASVLDQNGVIVELCSPLG